jgi:hypothetical protein
MKIPTPALHGVKDRYLIIVATTVAPLAVNPPTGITVSVKSHAQILGILIYHQTIVAGCFDRVMYIRRAHAVLEG